LLAIRGHEPAVDTTHARAGMWVDVKAGVGYLLRHPLLRPVALCTATSNLFGTMAVAILVLFEVRSLGLSPGVIGLVLALGNIGFVLGALTAPRLSGRLGVGPTIVGAAMVFASAGFLLPLAPRAAPVPLLVAWGLLLEGGGTVYNI